MKKSDINQPKCYYDRYIEFCDDIAIGEMFARSINEIDALDVAAYESIGDAVYAPGKWTIRDIFQHLIDVEHILAYRALRIARNDRTRLPGFEEDLLAANVSTSGRSLTRIIAELRTARTATMMMFETFTDEALQRSLKFGGSEMSALAFGFTICGHQRYHEWIIRERYLPLANSGEVVNSTANA